MHAARIDISKGLFEPHLPAVVHKFSDHFSLEMAKGTLGERL